MTVYDDRILAQLTGATVRAAVLARFDFASGPMRLWSGVGDLDAAAGGGQVERWRGVGQLASIGGVAQSGDGLAAEEIEFTLSAASSTLLASFAADAAETSGRDVVLYEVFLDADQSLVIDPALIFVGTMGPPSATRDPATDSDPPTRIVTVRAVNLFANRARPTLSFFSDSDQRAVSADDAIFSRMGDFAGGGRKVQWPVF